MLSLDYAAAFPRAEIIARKTQKAELRSAGRYGNQHSTGPPNRQRAVAVALVVARGIDLEGTPGPPSAVGHHQI